MTAPLLYTMIKSKSSHPLHAAIKLQREDVVFLFLIEFDSQVSAQMFLYVLSKIIFLVLCICFYRLRGAGVSLYALTLEVPFVLSSFSFLTLHAGIDK